MRRLFAAALIILAMLMSALPCLALDTSLKVYDDAGLFTEDEQESLMEKAQAIAEKRRMDVVVVTTNDTGGRSSMAYADDFFDYNGFGYGNDYDGVLLLIDYENGNYWISTSGKAIRAINNNAIDKILDKMEGDMRAERFYEAADIFLNEADYYLSSGFAKAARHIPGYLIFACVIAGVSVAVMAIQNKGIKTTTPGTYLVSGSVNLRDNRDIYIRTSVTKRNISSSGGGGSGSSTHRSSSGRSHGGGGRSFR